MQKKIMLSFTEKDMETLEYLMKARNMDGESFAIASVIKMLLRDLEARYRKEEVAVEAKKPVGRPKKDETTNVSDGLIDGYPPEYWDEYIPDPYGFPGEMATRGEVEAKRLLKEGAPIK